MIERILRRVVCGTAATRAQSPDLDWFDPASIVAEPALIGEFVRERSRWPLLALECLLDVDDATPVHPHFEAWKDEDGRLTSPQRDREIDSFIELLQGVDALFVFQVTLDVQRLSALVDRRFTEAEETALESAALRTYRAQGVVANVKAPTFRRALEELVTAEQLTRIYAELSTILEQ